MREKIARWLRTYKLGEVEVSNPKKEDGIIAWNKASKKTREYWLNDASEVLALFREEIEKLKPLGDEEIMEVIPRFREMDACVCDGTDMDAIAQAQLDDIKRQLFEKLEGK